MAISHLLKRRPVALVRAAQVTCRRLLTEKEADEMQARASDNMFPGLEMLKMLSDDYDLTFESFYKNLRRKFWESREEYNELNEKRLKVMGPDLSTAHFVTARGGKVKFKDMEPWYSKEGKPHVPRVYLPDYKVEAVDCSGMEINHEGIDNFGAPTELAYLNLSGCRYVDDHCLDKLTRFRHSLLYLDISGCSKVTERGISSLHRLPRLRCVDMADMRHVLEAPLLALLLEDALPGLTVTGVDYNDLDQDYQKDRIMPKFLTQFEQFSIRYMRRTRRIKPAEERELYDNPVNPLNIKLLPPPEYKKSEEEEPELIEPADRKLLQSQSRN